MRTGWLQAGPLWEAGSEVLLGSEAAHDWIEKIE